MRFNSFSKELIITGICNIAVSIGLVFVQHYAVFAADSPCNHATDCSECMQVNPRCGWCLDTEFLSNPEHSRCDERSNLMTLCSNMTSTFSESSILRDGDFNDTIQVRPQKVKVTLRPGQPATFNVSVKRAPNFPVDIYFLVDASFSMESLILKISRLAGAIASNISVITKNYRLGYGTFVDKDVVPFIEGPLYPNFPCNHKMQSNCEAVYPYRHLLDFTNDITLFQQRVNKSKLSGDFDTAEGGFDILMQLAACDEMIGWKPKGEARRIVLFVSDALPKIAGDGQLIGGLVQNDGKCHLSPLESDSKILTYNASKTMDYPSLSQLEEAMEKAEITPIIAVNRTVLDIYRDIAKAWSSVFAAVEELKDNSDNIVDLVRNNYQKISSLVRLNDAPFDDNINYDYKPLSPKCFGAENRNECPDVRIGDQVDFEVSVTARSCPNDLTGATKSATINITGFGVVQIDIEYLCECECTSAAQKNSSQCKTTGTLECAICKCNEGFFGNSCQCDQLSSVNPNNTLQSCLSDPNDNTTICSSQGSCVCGQCVCNKQKEPKKISGRFCQCKNFGCPVHNKQECGGTNRGNCVCGQCKCEEEYAGDNCGEFNCNLVKETKCKKNGISCGNQGRCDCTIGRCVCNSGFEGEHCERSVGSKCNDYQNCTLCRGLNRTDVNCADCENYHIIPENGAPVLCSKKINATCDLYFGYNTTTNLTTINWDIVCPGPLTGEDDPNLIAVIAGTMAGIIFIGLLLLLLWKLLLLLQDDNPIYVEPDQKFENPVFNSHID